MFAITKIDGDDLPKWCTAIEAYRAELAALPAIRRKDFMKKAVQLVHVERAAVFGVQPLTPTTPWDYADGLFRLMRMTGLVTVSGGRLVIAPERVTDVDEILSMPWPLRDDWNDRDAFYSHFGSATEPRLPWQDVQKLRERVEDLRERTQRALDEATFAVPASASLLVPTAPEVTAASRAELQAQYERITEALQQVQQLKLLGWIRTSAGMLQVSAFFDRIMRRGDPMIFDPPSQLEWNTWRSLLALDHTDIVKGNFTMDTNLEPLTRAPGNGPDGVATFPGFDVVFEPTLKTGPKQWNDESEPIYRHAVLHTNSLRKGGDGREVYTLAIAPKIEPALAAYFLNAAKGALPIPDMQEPPVIIPITIEQIKQLLAGASQVGGFRPDELWFMFEVIREQALKLAPADSKGYLACIQQSLDDLIAMALQDRPLAEGA